MLVSIKMKKMIIPGMCIMILLFVILYLLFMPNGINSNTQISNETIPTQSIEDIFEEGVSGTKTLENIKVSLINYKVDDIEKMNFKTQSYQCTKGTAMTLLLYSNNIEVPLTQIEKVELRTKGGTLIDAEINTFVLNNKKACVVLIKVEDNKELSSMNITIKTYDGKMKNMEIPQEETTGELKLFSTPLGDATYGDVVYISGTPYYILETAVFESYNFKHGNQEYSESIVGTALTPLTNLFQTSLSKDNFSVVYYNEEKDDYGTSVEMKLNDEEHVEKYGNRFNNIYVELLTCIYRIEIEGPNDEVAIGHKEYMIENTWYKIATEENGLLKTKGNTPK